MLSKVARTNSPFSLGNVFLFMLTLNIEISIFSQSSGGRIESSTIIRSAIAVLLHVVVEFDLVAAAAWLRRPPPAEREGMKAVTRLFDVPWAV